MKAYKLTPSLDDLAPAVESPESRAASIRAALADKTSPRVQWSVAPEPGNAGFLYNCQVNFRLDSRDWHGSKVINDQDLAVYGMDQCCDKVITDLVAYLGHYIMTHIMIHDPGPEPGPPVFI